LTYVVNESCIRCKTMDCVDVCPVDCFYEGENMLVIHPDECIDCGVCESECPVDAIKPATEPGLEKWLSLNENTQESGQILRSRKHPRPTPRSGRGSRTSSNTSHQIRARVIEVDSGPRGDVAAIFQSRRARDLHVHFMGVAPYRALQARRRRPTFNSSSYGLRGSGSDVLAVVIITL
jgi:ferredoxin